MNLVHNSSKESLLYVVATPIGNLGDITHRAVEVLSKVDKVICEDSRVTQKLLRYLGLNKEILIYNDHSNEVTRAKIIQQLQSGKTLALVSDAGTPLIADPGYKLIQAAIAAGIKISSLPGACAPIVALSASGLPTDKFCFAGFFSNTSSERCRQLEHLKELATTLIFFTTSSKLLACLQDAEKVLGNRQACIARELSKIHEEFLRGSLLSLLEDCNNHPYLKGEFVLLIEGNKQGSTLSEQQLEILVKDMLKKMSVKDTVQEISTTYKLSRKQIYDLCLKFLG